MYFRNFSETTCFICTLYCRTFSINKPGTVQVGAISKAQKDSKTKTTFSTTGDNKNSQKLKIEKKNPIFFEFFFEVSGKSHSAEKCERGTLWDFLNIHSVAKYQKLMGGTI